MDAESGMLFAQFCVILWHFGAFFMISCYLLLFRVILCYFTLFAAVLLCYLSLSVAMLLLFRFILRKFDQN